MIYKKPVVRVFCLGVFLFCVESLAMVWSAGNGIARVHLFNQTGCVHPDRIRHWRQKQNEETQRLNLRTEQKMRRFARSKACLGGVHNQQAVSHSLESVSP
jgi:hypothetical protein